jgi:Putative peptidoglycan binding domain
MADPGKFKRALYPPSHEKGPVSDGDDVVGVKRAISRAGFFEWQEFDDAYNEAIADAVERFQRARGLDPTGAYGSATHSKLRAANVPSGKPQAGEDAFDDRGAALYRQYMVPELVPSLGPTFRGGVVVLKHDLTHPTGGLPRNSSGVSLWPAFDDAFEVGCNIIAPEAIEVYQASSSNPGDACYAHGASGLDWWFGHLVAAPAVGTKIRKGSGVGRVCPNSLGGGPHVHVAINVERLWGRGAILTHRTSYSHGAPLIGDQLAAGRALKRAGCVPT